MVSFFTALAKIGVAVAIAYLITSLISLIGLGVMYISEKKRFEEHKSRNEKQWEEIEKRMEDDLK